MAVCKFPGCLDKVPPIRPKPRLTPGDNRSTGRTRKARNKLSRFKVFSYILALMEVRSRNYIYVNIFFFHVAPQFQNSLIYIHIRPSLV